jgi:hypothetical protein
VKPRKEASTGRQPPEDKSLGTQRRPEKRKQMEVVIERGGSRDTAPREPVAPPKKKEPEKNRRVTIEEVEDSDDEREEQRIRKANDELPFRNVSALHEGRSAPALPRKPSEPTIVVPRGTTRRRKREPRDTTQEDEAIAAILGEVRNVKIPLDLGVLIDSNPKLLKHLSIPSGKSRRVNFVKTTEGDVLAAKVSNFLTSQVAESGDESDSEDESGGETDETNVRMVTTNLVAFGESGQALEILMFDALPQIVTSAGHDLEEGSVIVGDPVLQYFEALGPEARGKEIKLVVGALSGKLRCLLPLVRGIQVESIMDSGSQIVSMSLATAEKLRLEWDPSITILMQAANEEVQRTLGVARNVQFKFGGVTLYLQIHILRAAPYDVLLGRPFEILAETIVASKRNGDVNVTLSDPFTGKTSTLPTYPRGFLATQNKPGSTTSTDGSDKEKSPQDF